MCWDVEVNRFDVEMGAAVLVSIDDERSASSNPSRYIWSDEDWVLRGVRLANAGAALVISPSTLMADAVIIQ